MTLSSSQRKHLRGLAHGLSAAVHVGRSGVSDAVVSQVDRALLDHELIKVKLQADRDQRTGLVQDLVERTGAEVAGVIGGVAILYRAHPDPDRRRVVLPER